MAKFGEEISRTITICNESPYTLHLSSEFYADSPVTSIESISNESDSISMHSALLFDFEDDDNERISYSAAAATHFQLDAPTKIHPLESYQTVLAFRPNLLTTFPDEAIPPFFQCTKISLCFTDNNDCVDSHFIVVDGLIAGIDVEFFPKTIDMRNIYVGEEHCAFIKVLNVDVVVAKVKFDECLDEETCGLRITPVDGFALKPCERGIFNVSFFTLKTSHFLVNLRFKVINGLIHNVQIKGTGQHIQLRTFPELVEFGSIPFAVPQKRFMLLMNPLSVPITLQVTVNDDGAEQPLVFNIRDPIEMLPITIRDPIKHMQETYIDLCDNTEIDQNIEFNGSQDDLLSVHSVSVNDSEYSVQFEENVLEPISGMTNYLLQNLKTQKIFDKSETEKRVIQEALRSLLNMQYFSIMKKHDNFIFLDWNAVPSDPKEIYCDTEIINLRPNTGRSISILIIPNRVGYYHRSLTVRVCPVIPQGSSECSEASETKTLIESHFLCSKLWYEYNCCTPEIDWINYVDLTDRITFAGEEYEFEMGFDNKSYVAGFIHFDVIKDIEFQYLTTRGGKLSPTGQSMYTTLVSLFPDPGVFHNTLYIDLQYNKVMEIPIEFLVEGVPLYFEPNIREGFDAGQLFMDTKERFTAQIFKYSFPVRVINRGFRNYRLNISRLNTYNPALKASSCVFQPLTARFDITPKLLEVPSQREQMLEILVTSYEEGVFFCDFLMIVTDLKYPKRKQMIRFTVKAKFTECQLVWDRKQLTFHFEPKDPLKERPQMRRAQLINPHNLPIQEVLLEVVGPFRIKELYEHTFEKQIHVDMTALEQKEIFVNLNKSTMKQHSCKLIEGRINVTALSTTQKCLKLQLTVKVPEIHILQPELVLFDRGYPYNMNVALVNHGCTAANFKWRRIEESRTFIGTEDTPDLVADILSQILRTLEYNFTCEDETNLTLRYQECRCQFHKEQENGSVILDIIDEIINDLDLAKRRFLIRMDDMPISLEDTDRYSDSSYVHHTIDYILNRLNIESSQQLSEPSSEYCFSDRFIYFYEKTGQLDELQDQNCLLHLPHVRQSYEVKSLFQLDVIGGRSQYLAVTLVNLMQKIKFQKDNIYVNIRPWYETFNTVVRISNVTRYPLQLIIHGTEPKDMRLIDGYAKLMQDNALFLDPWATEKIKVSGILGFNENFLRRFTVFINDSAYSSFRLRGQGILPILNITTPLPKVEQSMTEIMEEYTFMRKIYNYETFKSITECDSELAANEEEGVQEQQVTSDFSELSESEDDMSSDRQRYHDIQFFKMTKTYVLVNNNQEMPNATVLNQMLVTERYLERLTNNPDLYNTHQKVYQNYVNLNKSQGYKLPVLVKHFTVQPLPCEQLGYILDLGPLTRNTIRRFEMRLHFFGPGKLIAAARTAVRIPGLFVDFNVENHPDMKFTYWAEKCTEPEFFNKGYRNMWERLLDEDNDPKLKHAHSFDFDDFIRHQRAITDKDRRMIEEYYNSLNYSVYPDHKHHFTLAKIFTSYHSNFSDIELRLVGFLKPDSKYYVRDQRIVDYIYIDLHMGPTLPVLIRGVIKA
ncbi:GH10488 [Drosophila grimshawi]|uniref:GH10488 n=1 Tax=Drosophila grimshawi TaxID=7222 RepID=B4JDU8_DROGR|nr:GH10488 [Drosophila grimshawi]